MTKEGLQPLQPGVLGVKQDSWEVSYTGRDEGRRSWLMLNLPDAFDNPEKVVVDATWHQPELRALRADELLVQLADRYVDGVEWEPCGLLSAPADSELTEDRDGLLRLLSLKNQRFLDTEGFVLLANALGAKQQVQFAKIVGAISTVKVTPRPYAKKSHGFKYVYELVFEELDEADLPRLDLLCRRLLDALAAWTVDEVVELSAEVKNLGKTLLFN
jgi:type VI secretion system protein ImpG